MIEEYNNMIRPSDLYEWTINALQKGLLSPIQEEETLKNLKSLDWIKRLFDSLPPQTLHNMYFKITESIIDNSMPIDIMALSCMYYNFSEMGIETNDLREMLNSDEYVRKGIEAMFKSSS